MGTSEILRGPARWTLWAAIQLNVILGAFSPSELKFPLCFEKFHLAVTVFILEVPVNYALQSQLLFLNEILFTSKTGANSFEVFVYVYQNEGGGLLDISTMASHTDTSMKAALFDNTDSLQKKASGSSNKIHSFFPLLSQVTKTDLL